MPGRGCDPKLPRTIWDLTRGLKVIDPDSERINDVLGLPL